MKPATEEDLRSRIEELEIRLEEAEQLIEAIKAGEVDAFAVQHDDQPKIFTLQSGDFAYRILIENFSEGAVNLTEDGLIVYSNSYFHEMLGLTYEKVVANSIFSFIHPDSKDLFHALFTKSFGGQSKGEINLQAGTHTIPVYISLTSLYPNLPTVGMIVSDLTEKKQHEIQLAEKNISIESANRKLKERNEFIETIIDTSHELIAVYGPDLTLLTMNKAASLYSGKPKEEMIGKKLSELYPSSVGSKSEADLRAALNGQLVSNEPFMSILTGRFIQNYITPLRDENGKVYAALAIAQDVSEIMQSQEDLKKSQQHFSLLFRVSPVAKTISLADEGTIIDVNPAWERMFERTREDVIGKSVIEMGLITPELRDEKIKLINEGGGAVHGTEIKFNLGNGRSIYSFTSIVTLELDGKKCYLCAFFDITQRKNDEEQIKEGLRQLMEKNAELQQMNAELASFTYIASHDLQEPLRKIQTFINRILDKENGKMSADTQNYFDRINSSAARMQNLITALLTYSRTNTAELTFEPNDLNDLVEEVLTNLNEVILENNATIEVKDLPVLDVMPLQFMQLFSNLILNSLKYRKAEVAPHIQITAERVSARDINKKVDYLVNEHWKITVADNGIGFDQQHAEKIFGLFKRLHGVAEYEGTGIGLAICKKIVENHKGFITATGNPGMGAKFEIYLPVKAESNEE